MRLWSEISMRDTAINLAALIVTIALVAPCFRGPEEMFVFAGMTWILPALVVWRDESRWRYL